MNTPSRPDATQPLGVTRRYRWLPAMKLEPGMVIARPVVGLSGVLETLYVAVGSTITTNMVAQLVVKGVECVAVFDATDRDATSDAADRHAFEARLTAIFGPAPDVHCTALKNALLQAQHTLC